MTSRVTERVDLLRAAIGVFVFLGIVLTGVAGYALWQLGGGVGVSPGVAVSLLSGASLVVFAVALTKWLRRPRAPRQNV